MKNNKLYALNGNFNIIEYEIVKETPKQYIARPVDKNWSLYERTIKKSTMEHYNLTFRCTLADAKILRQEKIQQAINHNNDRIVNLTQCNIELTQLLNQSQEDAANGR